MDSRNDTKSIWNRLLFAAIGSGFAMFDYVWLRGGEIRSSKGEPPRFITSADDPVEYWMVIVIFAVFSAVAFYGAFKKDKVAA